MIKHWGGLLALALILSGCGPSPAEKAFGAFRKAVRNGNCVELMAVAEGQAKTWAESYCSPAGGMTVYGQSVPGKSAADFAAEMSGSPAWATMKFHRETESQEKQADGSVKLVILEKPLERPSNFSKPAPPWRYRVTAKESGGVWKLTDYAEEQVAQP